MNPQHQQAFEATLENEPRSKLDPYCELILRWRRQGKSYRQMIKLMESWFSLRVSYCALYKFVKRRSRPRNPELQPEPELRREPEPMPATPAAAVPPTQTILERTEGGSDPYAEVRARMARDKATPVPPKPAKRFEYTDEDSIKPIVYLPTAKKED